MSDRKPKTGADVLREFDRVGISVNAWAAKNGFNPQTVRSVISGRISGRIGEGHRIAVTLGMKDGEILDDENGCRIAA